MTISISYSGTDPATMVSDGTTLTIAVNSIEVYNEDVTLYTNAQAFADAVHALSSITAVLSDNATATVESIFIGSWDLLASDAQLGIVGGYVSILSNRALMSWAQAELLLGAQQDERSLIESLINSVSDAAELYYAKRPLKSREHEEVVDGPGGDLIMLKTYPVSALEVFYDVDRLWPVESEIEVLLYADDGIARPVTGSYPRGRQVIKLVYTAGYDPVPMDLVTACAESVAYQRGRLQQQGAGVRSMSAPNGIQTTYELTFPMNAQRIFEAYRDWKLA